MHHDAHRRVVGPSLLAVALALPAGGCDDTKAPLGPEVDPAAPPGDCRTTSGTATLPTPVRPSSCWSAGDLRLRRTSDCQDVIGGC